MLLREPSYDDILATIMENKNRYEFLYGQLRADINRNFMEYGVHPHCVGCGESCKQYNAENALRIVCKRGEWRNGESRNG